MLHLIPPRIDCIRNSLLVSLATLAAAGFMVLAPAAAAERGSPGATTLTLVCDEGQTITFSFAGIGVQWATHVDSIDGEPTDGIFVIVYWAVFSPLTGTTTVARDLPAPLPVAQCTWTSARGNVVTARFFQTPPLGP